MDISIISSRINCKNKLASIIIFRRTSTTQCVLTVHSLLCTNRTHCCVLTLHIVCWHYTLCTDTKHCVLTLHIVYWHYTLCTGTTHCVLTLHTVYWHYTLCTDTTHCALTLNIVYWQYKLFTDSIHCVLCTLYWHCMFHVRRKCPCTWCCQWWGSRTQQCSPPGWWLCWLRCWERRWHLQGGLTHTMTV